MIPLPYVAWQKIDIRYAPELQHTANGCDPRFERGTYRKNAGWENRTLDFSLEGYYFTIKLIPRKVGRKGIEPLLLE
jgi:hypothetical protein